MSEFASHEQLSWRGFIVIMQQVLAPICMYPGLIYIQNGVLQIVLNDSDMLSST